MSTMKDPEYLYTCNSCFRCVQECTKGIFSRAINPEYRELGDEYWTSDVINCTWYQAHTGNIPVSGAGYRGPFVGKGFDSMWTDMSEIVRPTRDGIHGREYINTCIELSRRPDQLAFNDDGSLYGDNTDASTFLESTTDSLYLWRGLDSGTYYWKVIARSELGTEVVSVVYYITIDLIAPDIPINTGVNETRSLNAPL